MNLNIPLSIDFDNRILTVNGKTIYSETNVSRETLADALEKYVGVKEYDGIVAEIQKWYYGYISKTPWCCTCVTYFANKLGLSAQIPKSENVDVLKNFMNFNHMLDCTINYGGGSYKAKRGDLIFFSDRHIYEDCTHIGVIQNINHETGMVTWIGGNTNDAIKSKTNNFKTDKYVVAFGRVDY